MYVFAIELHLIILKFKISITQFGLNEMQTIKKTWYLFIALILNLQLQQL